LHQTQNNETNIAVQYECGVCRRIAGWVKKSARNNSGETSIIEEPIGDDPEVLRALNPDLDIWDAYATILF